MEKKRWVQHISGQGEKWELHDKYTQANSFPNGTIYTVRQNNHPLELRLPRSEYRLCDPPEVWRDVTEECLECPDSRDMPKNFIGGIQDKKGRMLFEGNSFHSNGYRLRKVQLFGPSANGGEVQWAFIVEQKVSE